MFGSVPKPPPKCAFQCFSVLFRDRVLFVVGQFAVARGLDKLSIASRINVLSRGVEHHFSHHELTNPTVLISFFC